MADGFYTNDEDYLGCFGGYGSDGAEAYETAIEFGGGFTSRQATGDRAFGSGGFGAQSVRQSGRFKPSSRGGCNGGYGRAA